MVEKINLKIYLPTEQILDEDVVKIKFHGKEGYVTLLPKHVDYVSSFDANIMSYTDESGQTRFIAIHKGTLVKYKKNVRITTFKAIKGDDPADLRSKIKEVVEREDDLEKQIDINLRRLELFVFENIMNKM